MSIIGLVSKTSAVNVVFPYFVADDPICRIEEFGSFDAYLWQFVDGHPRQNRWRKQADVPASSLASEKLSKDLKQRGFKFVGSRIVYAHMQAAGLVNDHLACCFRDRQCQQLA